MARPKRYGDDYLLSCIDTYWAEYCHQNPDRITYKSLEAYLMGSNKADLPADTLMHNKKIHEKIESLRAAASPHSVNIHPEDVSTGEQAGISRDEYRHLAETNEKLKSFISRTYIHGICCHLVSEELHLSINSTVKKEAADRDVIKAGMEPFSSPVINELAAMFNLDEEYDEQNKE